MSALFPTYWKTLKLQFRTLLCISGNCFSEQALEIVCIVYVIYFGQLALCGIFHHSGNFVFLYNSVIDAV